MKKLNRREKIILRLTLIVILAVVLMQVSEAYYKAKDKLKEDNENLRSTISTMINKLEEESEDKYNEQADALEKDLIEAKLRVLELPNENDATVFMSKVISENAEGAGVNVNAISPRKATEISAELGLTELHTYFGYDCDLPALLNFFEMLDAQNFYISIESLNITQRRTNLRGLKSRRIERVERKPLNGNAILTTIFRPNPEGKQDKYETKVEPKKLEIVKIVEAAPVRTEDETKNNAKNSAKTIARPEGRDPNRPALPSRTRPTRTLIGGEPQKGRPAGPVRVAPATKKVDPPPTEDDYEEESSLETGLVEQEAPQVPLDENGQPIQEIEVPKLDKPVGDGPSNWPEGQKPKPNPRRLDNRPRALSHTTGPLKPIDNGNQ